MLYIEKDVFLSNLKLTQKYCQLQIDGSEKDFAKVFRSCNPIIKDKSLYSFRVEYFDFDIEPNVNYCSITDWSIDPLDSDNIVIDTLFARQFDFRNRFIVERAGDKAYSGKILISQIDCTVIDGASEVQSRGLIDVYDIPAIDTWFYMTHTTQTRLLFAWIPFEYVDYVNDAILVNCVDCLGWFEDWYKEDFNKIMRN